MNHTRKRYPPLSKINGKIISNKQGWVTLHIFGDAFERGYAHGILIGDKIKHNIDLLPFFVRQYYHITLDEYITACVNDIKPIIIKDFKEFYEELNGIEYAMREQLINVSIDDLIGWNSIMSMHSYFTPTNKNNNNRLKCSAFIATGDATKNGDIIMAHNTHTDYVDGQLQNVILYITPTNGYSFVMQCSAGNIASGVDWFICSSGIMGCETTIYGINYKPIFGSPFFCRIRKAMQYGKTIDDYVDIMLKNNAGDYACSWLLGNTKNNEIACFEIGLKEHSIQKTFNGLYYGMNSTIDNHLRTIETIDNDIYNITTTTGSRRLRMNQLLNNQYYGKITMSIAKKILADHYNVYKKREAPNSRSICRHSEVDGESVSSSPFYPFGTTDGKVVNTAYAKKMQFIGRFGHCCGKPFDKKSFLKKHPEYKSWENVLMNMKANDWTLLTKN
jgi:hypothetical protein